MRLRVLDFETTGGQGREVIEAATVDLEPSVGGWQVGGIRSQLFRPDGPVSVQARAVHHIPDSMLRDATPASTDIIEAFLCEGAPVHTYVAHHAEFERSFLPTLSNANWICTAKTSRRAWPLAPSYSNQVLRYWLGLNLDPEMALPAHRAGPDAYVTAHILQQLLAAEALETLVEWSGQPSVVSFGKHKGKPWSEVPHTYLEWMVGAEGMSDRRKAGARRELDRRRSGEEGQLENGGWFG